MIGYRSTAVCLPLGSPVSSLSTQVDILRGLGFLYLIFGEVSDDASSQFHEALSHVLSGLGRCLEEEHFLLGGEGLCGLGFHYLLLSEIRLVT